MAIFDQQESSLGDQIFFLLALGKPGQLPGAQEVALSVCLCVTFITFSIFHSILMQSLSSLCMENAKDQVLDYMSHPVALQDLGCFNNTGTSCVTKFLLVESSQPCSSVVSGFF